MKDTTKAILTRAGIDLDAAKARMMGNEKLLLRMLFKLDCGKNRQELAQALDSGDLEQAVCVCHTLKGLYGGLSVTYLYDLFTRQTALLRAGDFAGAKTLLEDAQKGLDALETALEQARQEEQ